MNPVIRVFKSDFGRKECRNLEKKLGTPCFNFLEENQVILFVMTQLLLIIEKRNLPSAFRINCIDYAFVLTPAIKGFEGYLKKLIREKDLGTDIGVVFGGKRKDKVYTKLRDEDYDSTPKVILAEWISCRNRTLHYNKKFFVKTIDEAVKIYDKILDIIKESYEAYVEDSSYTPRLIFAKPLPSIVPKPKEEISIDDLRRWAAGR